MRLAPRKECPQIRTKLGVRSCLFEEVLGQSSDGGMRLMNMHIKHRQERVRVALLPIGLNRRAYAWLREYEVCQGSNGEALCIPLEKLRKESFERVVVDGRVWGEEFKVDVDEALLPVGWVHVLYV